MKTRGTEDFSNMLGESGLLGGALAPPKQNLKWRPWLLRNLGFYLYHCIFVNHDTMILTLNKIAYNFNQNNQ